MKHFTSEQFCEWTGLPMGTLKGLRASGSLLAAKPGGPGRGRSDLWAPCQVLAVAVSRALKKAGVAWNDAQAVLDLLWSFGHADLERQFRNGKNCLMIVVTPNGVRCMPQLKNTAEILKNEIISGQAVNLLRIGVAPSALNVEKIYRQILVAADDDGLPGERISRRREETVR